MKQIRNVTIVVGTQWGDEGKGKVVHFLSKDCTMVIRATGGNNAGHSIVVNKERFAVHLLPSSIIRPEVKSVIATGVVIDPEVLIKEITMMGEKGISITPRNLYISNRAHVIMPWHKTLDCVFESTKNKPIGTTKRGIGPTFSEKAARTGIRIVDLLDKGILLKKIKESAVISNVIFDNFYLDCVDIHKITEQYFQYGKEIESFICDTTPVIREEVLHGKVIIEGAQAMYLDLDYGTYPFVTSSNPIAPGCLVGAGIGPVYVEEIIGVLKAYTSRVGKGPFPTELKDNDGDKIRELGHEYGTTTNRPRRCGWLDLVLIKNAVFVNGLTSLCVNHMDTIGNFSKIKVCVGYRYKGKDIDYVPVDLENCTPIYKALSGGFNFKGETNYKDIDPKAKEYIEFIESYTGVPVQYIGIGPADTDTITKEVN